VSLKKAVLFAIIFCFQTQEIKRCYGNVLSVNTIVFSDDIRCVIVIGLVQRELKHYNRLFLLAAFFGEYLRGLFTQNTSLETIT